MVKIRLFRIGTKKRPFYRVVAVDQRRQRQGRVLDTLGTYDPTGGGGANLRTDAIDRWVELSVELHDFLPSHAKPLARIAVSGLAPSWTSPNDPDHTS